MRWQRKRRGVTGSASEAEVVAAREAAGKVPQLLSEDDHTRRSAMAAYLAAAPPPTDEHWTKLRTAMSVAYRTGTLVDGPHQTWGSVNDELERRLSLLAP